MRGIHPPGVVNGYLIRAADGLALVASAQKLLDCPIELSEN
jgi:hypothetical protein